MGYSVFNIFLSSYAGNRLAVHALHQFSGGLYQMYPIVSNVSNPVFFYLFEVGEPKMT